MEIEVIVSDKEPDGVKGLFDVQTGSSKIVRTTVDQLSDSFRKFSEDFSAGIESIEKLPKQFELDTIELNIEITGKGEFRIIAVVSAEAKGGIKLVFRRNSRV